MAQIQESGAAPARVETGPSGEARPATIAELRKAFAEDPGFALECAEKALTLTEAKAAYADVLSSRNQALARENEEIRRSMAPLGNAPLSCRRENSAALSDGGDPVEAFNEAVAEQMRRPGFESRKKAIDAVIRRDRALHQSYLEATNGRNANVQRAIREKFATAQ